MHVAHILTTLFAPDRRSHPKPQSLMNHRRRHLSSFSPGWCIGPPPVKPHHLTRSASVSHAPRTTRSSSTSDAAHKEPCSPKISCMGQIKTQKSAHAKGGGGGLTKLRRIFSERTMTVKSSSPRPRRRPRPRPRSCARVGDGHGRSVAGTAGSVSVTDMDPPLPVVRRDGGGGQTPPVSLWKRRNGSAMELRLEGLQLQKQEMQRELCLDKRFAARTRRPTTG